jgi:hypothetical protein
MFKVKNIFIILFVIFISNTSIYLLFKSSPYSKEKNSCQIILYVVPSTLVSEILFIININVLNEIRNIEKFSVQDNRITINLNDKLDACEKKVLEIQKKYEETISAEKSNIYNLIKNQSNQAPKSEKLYGYYDILNIINEPFNYNIISKEEKKVKLNNFYIINLFLVFNLCLYIFLYSFFIYAKYNRQKLKKFLTDFFN